jgi:fructose/tagatose bisphosphate aldolase
MLLDPLQSRVVFRCALERQFAVLAINADSPAAIVDCLEAALACDAPVIIETSLWQLTGRSFGAGDPLLGLTRYLADLAVLAGSERYREVPVIFHTDHIKGPVTLPLLTAALTGVPLGETGVSLRASTISLDSSELSESENLEHLTVLCRAAETAGVPLTLEMEAGVDAGVTEVAVAERLIGELEARHPGRLALWAPGVGTQHGFSDRGYPFSPQAVAAHQRRASELCGRPVGIALHGSSGLPVEALREGVAAGVVKVNWSSESLLLRSRAAQEFHATHGAELEKSHPRWKATAMDNGVQQFVAGQYVPRVMERMVVLGGAGQAGSIRAALTLAR